MHDEWVEVVCHEKSKLMDDGDYMLMHVAFICEYFRIPSVFFYTDSLPII